MFGSSFPSPWLGRNNRRKPIPYRPAVLALEDRCLLSTYTLTVLGPGVAYGINDAGLVVGGGGQAFTWDSANGWQALQTFGVAGLSDAYAVSPKGLIVGEAPTPIPGNPRHAFLDDHGTVTDLGTLGGALSAARGVNDAGQVVGWSYSDDLGHIHAFLWDSQNGLQDLGTFGGWGSFAEGINSSGGVVGFSAIPGDTGHAFIWDSQNGMRDIGSDDIESGAMGINNAGQVVGGANGHAFLYDGGPLIDLGNLGHGYGAAYAINDAGIIVGATDARDSWEQHGFVYADGVMTDLNDLVPPGSGLTIRVAEGINNAGEIVGYAQDRFSHNYAILLTPDDLAGPARAVNPAAADVFFAVARTEPVSPAVVNQPTTRLAMDGAFAASQPEVFTASPAKQPVGDAPTLHHQHSEDRADAAATALAHPFALDLEEVP